MKSFGVGLYCFIILSFLSFYSYATENLAKNFEFEQVTNSRLSDWEESIFDKQSNYTISQDKSNYYMGKASVFLQSSTKNDIRIYQKIKIEPNSNYKISVWAKTENVGKEGRGANISVLNLLDTSEDIKGSTNGWKLIEIFGKSSDKQTNVEITLGLGGYGSDNTGNVWFDNFSIEKVTTVPSNKKVIKLYQENVYKESTTFTNSKKMLYGNKVIWYLAIYLLLALFIFILINSKNINSSEKVNMIIVLSMLFVAFFIKIIFAGLVEGFKSDISCFTSWAITANNSFMDFYKNTICDYPPGYLYILWFVGGLIKAFNSIDSLIFIKLPAIISDIILSYIIYLEAKKIYPKFALFVAFCIAFNPTLFLNSSLWGMMDSVLALFVVLYLLNIYNNKILLATVFLVISILIKPQGMFFAPILLYELIKRRDIKLAVKVVLSFTITYIALILPFDANQLFMSGRSVFDNTAGIAKDNGFLWNTVLWFSNITVSLFGKDLFWLYRLLTATAATYPYASLNAFNFYGLILANTVQDSEILWIFSYRTWGLFFDVLIFFYAGFLYLKINSKSSPFLIGAFLNIALFNLSTRMHERYMFTSIILLLMGFVISKNYKIFYSYLLATTIVFLNSHMILYLNIIKNSPYPDSNDNIYLIIISAFSVLLLLGYTIVCTRIALLKK